MMRTAVTVVMLAVCGTLFAADPNHTAAEASRTPAAEAILAGYDDAAQVQERLAAMPLHPIEGIWEFPADGGVVAVEREDALHPERRTYRLIAVNTANRAVRPGTVLGQLWATAKRGVFRARLYTRMTDGMQPRLTSPRDFVAELDEQDSRLIFKSIKKGLKVDLWRLLPHVFRVRVGYEDQTPRDLGGLTRIYPLPAVPAEPIYL